MELERAISARRMVRAFRPEPLDDGSIDEMLDLARRGPSAGNTQATGFVVLDRPELVRAYWDITLPEPRRAGFRWQQLLDAPVLVLVTTDPSAYVGRYAESDKQRTGLGRGAEAWPVPYWWVDAGAVAQNLLLVVTGRGLGACLFGPFDHEAAIIEGFDLDPERRLVATIAIGRPLPDEPGRSSVRPRPPVDLVIVRPQG